ncbi:MAG: hypothetical protein NZ898_06265 [Myxococcota bacterium]|nr:hypothetical protein [Myxococcota bacterium]MDW8363356.1 hypothetical protein [Myxococcales bacterium]
MHRLAMLTALALLACARDGADEPDPRLVEDARAMQALLAHDELAGPMTEVDRAIAERRPFLAAQRLRAAAIPAARRMLERIEAWRPRSAEGRELHTRWRRAVAMRRDALERLAVALEGGEIESLPVVEAVAQERRALEEIVELHARLNAIRPLRGEERSRRASGSGESP